METAINFFMDVVLVVANILFSAMNLYYIYKTYRIINNNSDAKRILKMWAGVSVIWLAIYTLVIITGSASVAQFGRLTSRPATTLTLGVLLSDMIARYRLYQGKNGKE